jgi:glycosyltransferase involved in cell wall biosynthesis
VVGIVGRLQRWKRVELAIEAMAHVPEATLRVVGGTFPGLDEDYPDELRELASARGAAVDFAGEAPDGAAAIRDLDVLVHCADHEPFGLVLVEAMLAGVPIVASREGGPAEIVRDGVDGLLVDVERPREVAGAVAGLLADPGRRAAMGAAGRARALERFSAERMAADAWACVREVASR